MRVLSRIAGIHVLTAALLTWILLALGWSELFDLPGFESAKPPPAANIPVSTAPPDPIPKEARPRTVEPPAASKQAEPPRTALLEPPPRSILEEPSPPSVKAVEPPAAKAAPAVVEPLRPQPAPPAPVATAPPDPPRMSPPPVAKEQVVVSQPATPIPPPPAAPKVVEPLRPVPAPPPVVAQESPPPKPAPAPKVALEQRTAPPPAPPAEVRPLPLPPAPRAEPPAETRAPRPAAAPQQTARPTNWAPRMRIAGFGPDALATVLDEQRRAADDIPCVVFDRIRFRAGTARPLPGAQREIDVVARLLAAGPVGQIRIGSRIGTARMTPANRQLAVERARTVRAALTTRGVPADRMSLDSSIAYHTLIGDDLGPIGVPLVPSMGFCVTAPTA